jgi:hypothetical protein
MENPPVMAIFLLPLCISVFGTGYLLHYSDLDGKWKALAFAMTGTSLVLQFMFRTVHFLVPLLLQTAVSLWVVIYWKVSR